MTTVVLGSVVYIGAYLYTYGPIVDGKEESDAELPMPTCKNVRGAFA
jgi:hypothetical protein